MKSLPRLPSERRERLHFTRDLKMARSAHAYVRGSTQHFYAWLDQHGEVALPSGPPVWICGDCHVGNMRPVGASTGKAVVELRDLDQTVIGNPAYDLVRLGLSLAMAARSSDLPGVTTAHTAEYLVNGYESAFAGEKPSEDPEDLPDPIGLVMRTALKRSWRALQEERVEDEPRLPLGKKFWPLTTEERAAVTALVAPEGMRRLVTKLDSRSDEGQIRLLDAAYWVKGCSSLGLWRAAALVELSVTGKKGKAQRMRSLIDVKEAIEAWAPAAHRARLPHGHAERVVTGAPRRSTNACSGRRWSTTACSCASRRRTSRPMCFLKVGAHRLSPSARRVAVSRARGDESAPGEKPWMALPRSRPRGELHSTPK